MDTKYYKTMSSFGQTKRPQKRRSFFLFGKNKPATRPARRVYAPTQLPRTFGEKKSGDSDRKRIRIIASLIILAVVLLTWLILLIYLPYFRINRTNYQGLSIIKYDEINSYIKDKYLSGGKIFPANNYFFVPVGKIKSDLTQKYSLKSIEVNKIFPDTLSIILQEKVTTIIYDNGSSYSLLDKEGTAIKIIEQYASEAPTTTTSTSLETAQESGATTSTATTTVSQPTHRPDFQKLTKDNGDIPILYDTRDQAVAEKQTFILAPDIIKSIIDWHDLIEAQGIGEVKYMEINDPMAGLRIYLNKPWYLVVDTKNISSDIQLQNLKTIINSRDIKPQEYIDLRFGDRVYWK